MSLDGGYIGSLDHAIANLHIGRIQGHDDGLKQGYQEGYQQGFKEGEIAGWNAGIARGNEEILKQMEFTRQQIAEKEIIQVKLAQQHEVIKQLEAKVAELEQKNKANPPSHQEPPRLIDGLKQANSHLQEQIRNLEEQLRSTTSAYATQLWQHNKNMVFMNTVRSVLEDLTDQKSIQASHIRKMFAKKYEHQVSKSLEKGLIRLTPDQDEEFAKSFPKTQKFIIKLLSNTQLDPEPAIFPTSH